MVSFLLSIEAKNFDVFRKMEKSEFQAVMKHPQKMNIIWDVQWKWLRNDWQNPRKIECEKNLIKMGVSMACFENLPKSYFLDGLKKLEKRLEKYIELKGDYVKIYKKNLHKIICFSIFF